jgi:predicted lipoprotein with Yx(FWY)xxD motif
MMKSRLSLAVLPASFAALVAVAGCGGGSSNSTTATSTSTAGATGGGAATIDLAKNVQLGPILTDSQGNTVYVFAKDTNGKSACSGSCASVWPPVTASGSPKAGTGVDAAKLGTTKRSDGSTQVTYAGHPLYTYTADTSPGATTGNGVNSFGARWYAVRSNGSNAPVSGSTGSSSAPGSTSGGGSTTTGSSGGGYGY